MTSKTQKQKIHFLTDRERKAAVKVLQERFPGAGIRDDAYPEWYDSKERTVYMSHGLYRKGGKK